jgi:hypothetical protein
MEEDTGEDVFGGVDGHGGFEEAPVAFQGVVDGDVFEARVEHGGVEEHEAEMARGLGGDLVGVAGGAALHEVDSCDDVVDAEAEEGFAYEFSAEFGEVEGAEDGGFGLFIAWWAGAGRDDEDCGARVGESAEFLDLFNARWFECRGERVFQDEEHGMLTVGRTVELGLDVDAGSGGEGEAMADVDVSFGWGG